MRKQTEIDFTRLLGFETVADHIADDLDLRDQMISDKLGAKVGPLPEDAPPR